MNLKILFSTVLIIFSLVLFGQECTFYYPETEGAELVYQHFDKKDNLSSSSSQKVTSYKVKPGGAEATILVKTYDEKGKPVSESELKVKCESGTFYFDMKGYINQQMMSAYEDMEVKVETENLEMPGKLNAGDILQDGNLVMDISSGGMKFMTMQISITDRKVESRETITTKAGTFECFKISENVTTKAPVNVTVKTIEWLCPGTGVVKSESYSGGDKYMGKTELIALD